MSYHFDDEPRVAPRWHGWIWCTRRQRWSHVCEGDTLSECSRRLSAAVDARRTKDRYAVMTTAGMPTFRPGRTHQTAQDERSEAQSS